MITPNDIKNILAGLISPCLKQPQALRMSIEGTDVPVFNISVHDLDHGRMIGRQGSNILALKALALFAAEAALGTASSVVLHPATTDPPQPRPPWSRDEVAQAISHYLELCKLPRGATLVEGRPGQTNLVLAAKLPEDIEGPLSRWLNLMGVEGGTRILFDETTALR